MDEALETAYRATTYWVEGPQRWFGLRIGQACADLDELVRPHTSWAVITADNPRSEPFPPTENERRRRQLALELPRSALRCVAIGDGGGWPPEIGFFVPGIGVEEAMAIGRRWEQNAIVVGGPGQAPTLVRCR